MTLTVREPTLIIYLAANGFMIYTVYCAMKIFFDQPPVNRRRTLLCYALYWLVVSTVKSCAADLCNQSDFHSAHCLRLPRQLAETHRGRRLCIWIIAALRGNSVAHFKYMRRWQF